MTIQPSLSEPVVRSANGWLKKLEQCDVKYLVLDPDEDRLLVQILETRPEWTLDFWDRAGLLFVRSNVLQA